VTVRASPIASVPKPSAEIAPFRADPRQDQVRLHRRASPSCFISGSASVCIAKGYGQLDPSTIRKLRLNSSKKPMD